MTEQEKRKSFNIRYEIDVDLTVDEIWPDGDAPENPTSNDVRDLIEGDGGIERVIHDWNLDVGAYFAVSE